MLLGVAAMGGKKSGGGGNNFGGMNFGGFGSDAGGEGEPSNAPSLFDDKIFEGRTTEEKLAHIAAQVSFNRTMLQSMGASQAQVQLRDVIEKFHELDLDESGSLEPYEFMILLEETGCTLTKPEFKALWKHLDSNGDGDINQREFVDMLREQMSKYDNADIEELLKITVMEQIELCKDLTSSGVDPSEGNDDFSFWDIDPHAPYPQCPDGFIGHFRMWLHFTLEDEGFSVLSQFIFFIVSFLILVSALGTIFQSVREFSRWPGFDLVESIVSITFSAEIFLRTIACRNPVRFWKGTWYYWNFLNAVDLLSVLPFYLDIILCANGQCADQTLDHLRTLRILRLTRLFRFRRLDMVQENFRVLTDSLERSTRESGATLTLMIMFEIILASGIVYAFERGAPYHLCDGLDETACLTEVHFENTDLKACMWIPGQALPGDGKSDCMGRFFIKGEDMPADSAAWSESMFTSIPQSMWWCMTTITTVGYGDVGPITVPGRIFGCLTMITGLVVVAIFVTIIIYNFTQAHESYLRRQQVKQYIRAAGEKMAEKRSKDAEKAAEDDQPHLPRTATMAERELGIDTATTISKNCLRWHMFGEPKPKKNKKMKADKGSPAEDTKLTVGEADEGQTPEKGLGYKPEASTPVKGE